MILNKNEMNYDEMIEIKIENLPEPEEGKYILITPYGFLSLTKEDLLLIFMPAISSSLN